jgi:hypothetical protein
MNDAGEIAQNQKARFANGIELLDELEKNRRP